MIADELKLKLKTFIDNTIDLYMPCDNMINKFKNATAKLYVDQNMWRINHAIDMFADENHEIDGKQVIDNYDKVFFENGEFRLDVRDIIPSDMVWIKAYLPNKIILFKKEDFHHLFE